MKDGPSPTTIVVFALLATPVVLILIFWLVGSGSAQANAPLNDLRSKGLQWAQNEAITAGFENVQPYDALGRDRGWRERRDWKVCFQTPAAGDHPRDTPVELGIVRTDENCPSSDQGRFVPAGATMPDLTNRTAHMVVKILGEDASVRFLDRVEGEEVTRNLGDWKVCEQTPRAGARSDGVPATALVIPFEDRC